MFIVGKTGDNFFANQQENRETLMCYVTYESVLMPYLNENIRTSENKCTYTIDATWINFTNIKRGRGLS